MLFPLQTECVHLLRKKERCMDRVKALPRLASRSGKMFYPSTLHQLWQKWRCSVWRKSTVSVTLKMWLWCPVPAMPLVQARHDLPASMHVAAATGQPILAPAAMNNAQLMVQYTPPQGMMHPSGPPQATVAYPQVGAFPHSGHLVAFPVSPHCLAGRDLSMYR